MSLIRSFTTKRGKEEETTNVHVGRAASQRRGKPVSRSQISSPIQLISSTNALSFDAPDIPGTHSINSSRKVSSGSSANSSHSAEDSDASTLSITSNTDASSVGDHSPVTPEAETNHLSCYFKPAVNTNSGSTSPSAQSCTTFDAPVIPERVPSHSKKAHEHIHRKRSVQRLISPPSSVVRRSSTDMFKLVEAPRENPFGRELAQLDEVAEELSQTVRDAEAEADAMHIEANGLAFHSASEYLAEIHSLLYDDFLAEEPSWI